jgi:hypothetical protein
MGGWARRRMFPLTASLLLLAITMVTTTIGPTLVGRSEWALPYDYWGTLVAAVRLTHFDVGGLYTLPTGLVSLPGAAVILIPIAAVIRATGFSLAIPGPHNLHPAVWLLAGPYQILLSCITLFAADALAERLGVSRGKRALLAAASAGALWNVSGRWGHPEDAVAVGLVLSASSPSCCWRCQCCSRCCRGGGCRGSPSVPPCPRPCWWPRRPSPTGAPPIRR